MRSSRSRTPEILALDFPDDSDPIPFAIGRWGGCALKHHYLLAGGTDEALLRYALCSSRRA